MPSPPRTRASSSASSSASSIPFTTPGRSTPAMAPPSAPAPLFSRLGNVFTAQPNVIYVSHDARPRTSVAKAGFMDRARAARRRTLSQYRERRPETPATTMTWSIKSLLSPRPVLIADETTVVAPGAWGPQYGRNEATVSPTPATTLVEGDDQEDNDSSIHYNDPHGHIQLHSEAPSPLPDSRLQSQAQLQPQEMDMPPNRTVWTKFKTAFRRPKHGKDSAKAKHFAMRRSQGSYHLPSGAVFPYRQSSTWQRNA